jgi:hypothetical protein
MPVAKKNYFKKNLLGESGTGRKKKKGGKEKER